VVVEPEAVAPLLVPAGFDDDGVRLRHPVDEALELLVEFDAVERHLVEDVERAEAPDVFAGADGGLERFEFAAGHPDVRHHARRCRDDPLHLDTCLPVAG
jgi:hypothetical protein